MVHVKSAGQVLVEKIEAFILRYVTVPVDVASGDQALVFALWAIHTWVYEFFPATPYLSLGAATKQAGKTICMEVLSLLCRNTQVMATLRPLALVRMIEYFKGRVTLGIDEAEKLSSGAVGDLRSIFTTGYTDGGKHIISAGGAKAEFVEMRTFSPKMFAQIGDVMDVVRDRSIGAWLERAPAQVDFRANRVEAKADADVLVHAVREYFGVSSIDSAASSGPTLVQPMFLQGREREIWSPIFSIAAALRLDDATMTRLQGAASDLVGLKDQPLRTHADMKSERGAADYMAAEKALADLAGVFKAGEQYVLSSEVIVRLKAIAAAPWRTYKGKGLNEMTLAGLVQRFGVRPRQKKVKGVNLRAYSKVDVMASFKPTKGGE